MPPRRATAAPKLGSASAASAPPAPVSAPGPAAGRRRATSRHSPPGPAWKSIAAPRPFPQAGAPIRTRSPSASRDRPKPSGRSPATETKRRPVSAHPFPDGPYTYTTPGRETLLLSPTSTCSPATATLPPYCWAARDVPEVPAPTAKPRARAAVAARATSGAKVRPGRTGAIWCLRSATLARRPAWSAGNAQGGSGHGISNKSRHLEQDGAVPASSHPFRSARSKSRHRSAGSSSPTDMRKTPSPA